jgi:chromosome segregation ATPase
MKLESSGEIRERLDGLKRTQDKNHRELEELKRLRGAEASKKEPFRSRLKNYDDQILRLETHLENLPYAIQATEQKLEEAEKLESQRLMAFTGLEGHVAELQRLTKELRELLEKAQKVNLRILELNSDIQAAEKSSEKRLYRPFCSMGFHSLAAILDAIQDEAEGRKRKMLFYPTGAQRWPL